MTNLTKAKYLDIGEAFRNGHLFRDAAGTVPVTEVGQSVGLILYSDGSEFLCSSACGAPTLQKNEAGYFIESINGEWI